MTTIAAPGRASGLRPLRAAGVGNLPAAPPLVLPGRGASAFLTDAVSLLALVVSIPFIILGLGLPLALAVRLLLWVSRVL